MTQFCHVSNGIISRPQPLPSEWANVSNFNTNSIEFVASYNWYPFVPADKPAYTETTQKLVESMLFDGQQVNQVWTVVDLTPQEQAEFATARLTEIGNQVGPFLDQQVQVKQYDSILSATSWNLSNITVYKAKAEQATTYRDSVWEQFGNLVAGVQAGNTPLPTVDGWFATLPPLWHNGTSS